MLISRCAINYVGRAASKAGPAKRLIIIKEDGTVLVHEGKGREPINWQPKASIHFITSDDKIVLVARRAKPKEELRIELLENPYVLITRLTTAKFTLFGSELDIVNEIAKNPGLIEEGATLVSREVSTPHGRIDVVLRGKDGSLILVECKRSRADIDSAYQLKRYVDYYTKLGIKPRGVLAAPQISPQALKYLNKEGLKYVKIEPMHL